MSALGRINPDDRHVKNTSGASIPVGYFVKLKAAPTVPREVEKTSAATDAGYGVVANKAIPDDGYGDVQVGGQGIAIAGGSVAVNDRITSDANGKGVAASAGNACYGVAVTAASADGFFEIELASPGGTEMPG